jgi:hypothetical protein
MSSTVHELRKKEKSILFFIVCIWAFLIVSSVLRSQETSSEEIVTITVYQTNKVDVRVPKLYEELRRKYLLLATGYQENKINVNLLMRQYDFSINSNILLLRQLREALELKDAPKNIVSLGNVIAPDLGFELSYYRNIWGPLWLFGRVQTPVGASAGLGIAW